MQVTVNDGPAKKCIKCQTKTVRSAAFEQGGIAILVPACEEHMPAVLGQGSLMRPMLATVKNALKA